MNKPKVVVIVGPTASGKTSLSVELAIKFDGEIVSADSRQVYRKLDIGTAKATPEEMGGIPHHLIDVVDVDTVYNVTNFTRDATKAISNIHSRNKLPIIAGGTFFYIDMLLGKMSVPEVPPQNELRTYLEDLSIEALYIQLEALDPERAFAIGKENKRRIIRALEIVYTLGKVPKMKPVDSPYDTCTFALEIARDELRARFEARARLWLHNGFKEEIRGLLESNVTRERLAEIGFEYMIMLEHLDGETTEEEFVEKFVQKNWQYAKRQLTWLKRDKNIQWCTPTDTEKIFTLTENFLNK